MWIEIDIAISLNGGGVRGVNKINLTEGSVLLSWNLEPRLISKNLDQVKAARDGQPPLP